MKRWQKLVTGVVLVALLGGIPLLLLQREEPLVQARLVALADGGSDTQPEGYLRADSPIAISFPADHGPHLDYQTEWWYYTGNLVSDSGQHFGYQLTFFRRALVPPPARVERDSNWATDQVYMAHFALSDVAGSRYQAFERFSRGATDLAGAEAAPFRVWLEDWHVEEIGVGVTRMRAAQEDLAIDLLLVDGKGPILQGEDGYSRKGPEAGNASYYYSLPRLETSGTIRVAGQRHEVNGLSWMDHEWSTSGLAPDQVGWDWFSIQLDDGSELMVFQLRKQDGSIDPFSSGTLIAPDGSTRHLNREDFAISVEDTWRSPNSGAIYPARWTVTVPVAELQLGIEPFLADQELTVSYAYWEGAVRVEGDRSSRPVRGSGYVELTGYAGSMQGQF